ncbi:hypothetical protein bcgnr5380_61910 [Bacillus cereus]
MTLKSLDPRVRGDDDLEEARRNPTVVAPRNPPAVLPRNAPTVIPAKAGIQGFIAA